MLELILIAAIDSPHIFANEYCWARYRGASHEASMELASRTWGGIQHTPEADKWIPIYCSHIGVEGYGQDETN